MLVPGQAVGGPRGSGRPGQRPQAPRPGLRRPPAKRQKSIKTLFHMAWRDRESQREREGRGRAEGGGRVREKASDIERARARDFHGEKHKVKNKEKQKFRVRNVRGSMKPHTAWTSMSTTSKPVKVPCNQGKLIRAAALVMLSRDTAQHFSYFSCRGNRL